jgi:hypothetical protein
MKVRKKQYYTLDSSPLLQGQKSRSRLLHEGSKTKKKKTLTYTRQERVEKYKKER